MTKNKLLESEEKTIITFLLSVESVNVVHQLAKSCILEKKKNKITTFASNICNNNNKNGKLWLNCTWIAFKLTSKLLHLHTTRICKKIYRICT